MIWLPIVPILLQAAGMQDTPSVSTMYGGAIAFSTPSTWHLLNHGKTDTSEAYVFHVRGPTDSTTDHRTNVLVIARVRHDRSSLGSFSDALFNRMTAGDRVLVLGDATKDDRTRSIFWRGEQRGTPYVLLDKFAVQDTFYINLRFAMPLLKVASGEWQRRTLSQVNEVVATLNVNHTHVFQGDDPLEITAFGPDTRVLRSRDPQPAPSHKLPFNRDENLDGARFVWFVLKETGFPYAYTPAKDFPPIGDFTEVPADSARAGDVAWWPSFVAIYSGPPGRTLITAEGPLRLDSLTVVKGRPRFFRKLAPK